MVTLFGRGPTSYLAADRPQKSNLLHYKSYIESEASAVDIFSRRLRLRDLVSTRSSTWERWGPLSVTWWTSDCAQGTTRIRNNPIVCWGLINFRCSPPAFCMMILCSTRSPRQPCQTHSPKTSWPTSITHPRTWKVHISTNLQLGMGYYIILYHILYIPKGSCRTRVLQNYHDDPHASHFGVTKTLEFLSRGFWWPQPWKFVNKFIKTCDIFARSITSHHQPYGLLPNSK